MAERLGTVDEIVAKYAVISNPVKSKNLRWVWFDLLLFLQLLGFGFLVGQQYLGPFLLHFYSLYRMRNCSGGP